MSIPTYLRIASEVAAGLGEPGSLVPSEAEMREAHGASRSTVRRAMRHLEAQGLITAGQGARRQVRSIERIPWPMADLEDGGNHTSTGDAWATAVEKAGHTPDSDVQVSIESADEETAQALKVEAGDVVIVRSRLRTVNGEPHHLSRSVFPEWVADTCEALRLPGDQSAPEGLLASVGLQQDRMHDALSARMPTDEEAARLHMSAGTPLLVHERTGYHHTRPVRFMRTLAAADRVLISYDLKGTP